MGKFCTKCGECREIGQFAWIGYERSKLYPKRDTRCKPCAHANSKAWHKANYSPEHIRDKKLRKLYGITLEDQERMRREQGHKCAICLKSIDKKFAVDHCHTTGKVRAILCPTCNFGIGYLYDNPETMESAAAYIRQHRERHLQKE